VEVAGIEATTLIFNFRYFPLFFGILRTVSNIFSLAFFRQSSEKFGKIHPNWRKFGESLAKASVGLFPQNSLRRRGET
jgi:hypothetical protein